MLWIKLNDSYFCEYRIPGTYFEKNVCTWFLWSRWNVDIRFLGNRVKRAKLLQWTVMIFFDKNGNPTGEKIQNTPWKRALFVCVGVCLCVCQFRFGFSVLKNLLFLGFLPRFLDFPVFHPFQREEEQKNWCGTDCRRYKMQSKNLRGDLDPSTAVSKLQNFQWNFKSRSKDEVKVRKYKIFSSSQMSLQIVRLLFRVTVKVSVRQPSIAAWQRSLSLHLSKRPHQ